VRWGLVYRADSLDQCSDADHALLAALGIRAVCDLRRPGEGVETAPRFLGDGRYLRFAMDGETSQGHTMAERVIAGEITGLDVEWMVGVYAQLADTYAPRFGEILRLIAAGEVPLLFHCAAGKDRTGVVAAVLLALVGVSRKEIVADYHATAGAMAAFVDWLTITHPEALDAMTSQPPEYLEAPMEAMEGFLDRVEQQHGSIEGYVTGLGVDAATIDRLRTTLVE
jgi:protein-tyrosine phosphatase